MSLDTHDQFNLSTPAMKAAARALRDHADIGPDGSARAAVMAGLRHDHPQPARIPHIDGPSVVLTAPVIWLTGQPGSGLFTLQSLWVSEALHCGHRVLFVSPHSRLLGFREELEDEGVFRVTHNLSDPARQVSAVKIPSYDQASMLHPFLSEALGAALENALDSTPEPFWVVFDQHLPDPDLLDKLRSSPRVRTLVTAFDPAGDAPKAGDACVQTLGAKAADADTVVWTMRILQGSEDTRMDARLWDPSPKGLIDGAEMVISRLSARPSHGGLRTHTQRLEAVARACGFSSWHAAEGRRNNR